MFSPLLTISRSVWGYDTHYLVTKEITLDSTSTDYFLYQSQQPFYYPNVHQIGNKFMKIAE